MTTTQMTMTPPGAAAAPLEGAPGPAGGAKADKPADPPLKQLAIRGAIWTIGGYGTAQVLRLGSNMILTRLLYPKAFGVMAIVNVFLIGLHTFSDIGIGPSIVQNRRGEDRNFVNTAWTVQVIRGAILWLAGCALAYPVSRFYGEPMLAYYLPVSSLAALVAGFSSVSLHLQSRKLRLGRITLIELASQVAMIVAMIGWALVHRSVWALVVGGVVGEVVRTALSHRLEPERDRFHWDRDALREMFTFGRVVFLSTLLLFLANQSERMILGHYAPLDLLGIYSIGYFLARVGTNAAQTLAQKVLFPSFARVLREDRRRAMARYARVSMTMSGVGMAGMAALTALGPWFIRHMYDHRYWAAGAIVQVLAVQSVFDTMRCPANWLLTASGKPGYGIWAWLSRAMVLFVGLPLAYGLATGTTAFTAAVWVVALSALPPGAVFAYGVGRVFPELRRREWLGFAGTCAITMGLYFALVRLAI